MKETVESADLVMCMGTSQFSMLANKICKELEHPHFHTIHGDSVAMSLINKAAKKDPELRNYDVKLMRKNRMKHHKNVGLDNALGKYPVFFVGYIFLKKRDNYHVFLSTTIRKTDIIRTMPKKIKNEIKLLWVGRLSPEKGLFYLLRAVKELNSEKSKKIYRLNIVGDGPLRTKLQEKVNKLGIANLIRFHGFIPFGEKLKSIYINSDALLLPSLMDQQPKVTTEAMAYGIPVLASNIGGIPNIVHNGRNGLLFEPGSVNGICEAVQRIVNNQELYDKLVEVGYDFISSHTMEDEIKKMLKTVASYYKF